MNSLSCFCQTLIATILFVGYIDCDKFTRILPDDSAKLDCSNLTASNSSVVEWFNITDGIKDRMEGSEAVLRIQNVPRTVISEYQCATEESTRTFKVIEELFVKKFTTRSYTVTEGEDLKITCEVEGFPRPEITWYIERDGKNETIPLPDEEGTAEPHYNFFKDKDEKYPNAVLKIEDAVPSDRATYICEASNIYGTMTRSTQVRVKDKYAALWPFLGIVLEVFVLCLVILICEKRRAAKEASLEEEDEQYNGNMQSENSNLRHRK